MTMSKNNDSTATVIIAIANQSAPLPSFAAPPHSSQSSSSSSSSGMSPLTAILSLLVLIAIPALIYAFFFAINCPRIPLRRPERRRSQLSGRDQLSSSSDSTKVSKHGPEVVCSGGVKYRNEAEHEEEYGSECPVCLSAFAEGDYVRQLNDCKHSFHVGCIDKWLSSHSNCPVCRASVSIPAAARTKQQRPSPRPPAAAVDDDFRHGLPDAASLV